MWSKATDIVKQRTKDMELKRFAVDIMTEFGSFAYTKDRLYEMEREITKEIDRLGGNGHLMAMLDQLSVARLV